jgi:hypothetical protein
MGLRKLLVILMVVCSLLYITSAVRSQRHLIQFYADLIPLDKTPHAPPQIMPAAIERLEEKKDRTPKNAKSITKSERTKADGRIVETAVVTEGNIIPDNPAGATENYKPPGPTKPSEDGAVVEADSDLGDGDDNDDEDNDAEEEEEEEIDPDLKNQNTSQPWLALPRSNTHNRTVIPFEKQEGVIIVTKIHGPHQLDILEQSLCLLHYAYNRRPLYDILVFSTIPVSDHQAQPLREIVQPAKIVFVVDNRGLQEEINALTPERRDNFLKACQVSDPHNLTWWSNCPGRIAYNWQAEFRAWHIWRHPALKDYKWMMWLDADAFCTEEWKMDPVQAMIENDLVILFDNWPKGVHKGRDVQNRIREAFGVRICRISVEKGRFATTVSNVTETDNCKRGRVPDIHGFFHITVSDKGISTLSEGLSD